MHPDTSKWISSATMYLYAREKDIQGHLYFPLSEDNFTLQHIVMFLRFSTADGKTNTVQVISVCEMLFCVFFCFLSLALSLCMRACMCECVYFM